MICHIDAGNGIPIYEQIERQVKFSIANGSLLVGERLPWFANWPCRRL